MEMQGLGRPKDLGTWGVGEQKVLGVAGGHMNCGKGKVKVSLKELDI